MACGIFVVSCIGVLTPFLTDDLDLTKVQIGTLITAAYAMAATGSLVIGRVADVVGGPRLLFMLYGCSAAAIVGLAFSTSFAWMLVGMAFAGLALAACNPATNDLVAANVRVDQRGTLVGIKQSGTTIAWLLASTTMPTLAVAFGWRTALLAGLVLTITGAVLSRLTLRGGRGRPEKAVPERGRVGNGIGRIAAFAFFMSTGSAAVTTYLVLFATERCGISAAAAGGVIALVNASSAVSRVLAGRRADRRPSLWPSLRLNALMAVSAMAVLSMGTHFTLAVWLSAPLIGSANGAWATIVMVAAVTRFGDGHAGRASGTVVFAGHAGLLTSPIAFGTLIDATGAYELAWLGVAGCFGAAAAVTAVLGRRQDRVPPEAVEGLLLNGP